MNNTLKIEKSWIKRHKYVSAWVVILVISVSGLHLYDSLVNGTEMVVTSVTAGDNSVKLHATATWDNYCTLTYLEVHDNRTQANYTLQFPPADTGICPGKAGLQDIQWLKVADINHDGYLDVQVVKSTSPPYQYVDFVYNTHTKKLATEQ